jgi:hypothetical protein
MLKQCSQQLTSPLPVLLLLLLQQQQLQLDIVCVGGWQVIGTYGAAWVV